MNQALLTIDLGFGDAGKGSIVDFLTRAHHAHTVIRYNGGAQAGHRVVTAEPTPRDHVFSQFGSGALAGAATHLSRFMLIDPLAMLAEAQHLRALGLGDVFAHTTVDAGALIITPFQRAINRLRELARGAGRHGSCGMGIGETVADHLAHGDQALFAGDLAHPDILQRKLAFLREVNRGKLADFAASLPVDAQTQNELAPLLAPDWLDWLIAEWAVWQRQVQVVSAGALRAILQRPGAVIFEGAQGVLLDEWRGFHPHTTWSTTTLANAEQLLAEADYRGQVTRIGITRSYATRHGAGPFPTEDAGLASLLPDAANANSPWQQHFRVGWPDAIMLQYARACTGPLDYLAVTCLDRLAALPMLQVCTHYDTTQEGYATFTYRAGMHQVERITPAPSARDLAYQTQITRNLAGCTPRYKPLADVEELLNELENATATPISLLSTGPTAADKRWLSP